MHTSYPGATGYIASARAALLPAPRDVPVTGVKGTAECNQPYYCYWCVGGGWLSSLSCSMMWRSSSSSPGTAGPWALNAPSSQVWFTVTMLVSISLVSMVSWVISVIVRCTIQLGVHPASLHWYGTPHPMVCNDITSSNTTIHEHGLWCMDSGECCYMHSFTLQEGACCLARGLREHRLCVHGCSLVSYLIMQPAVYH